MFIPWKIYGGAAGSPSQHDVRFAGLPAVPAPLRIHPSLSFLTKSPGIEVLRFSDCCNGLLLFEHIRHHKSSTSATPSDDLLGYVVCNPATKHWETVPTYGPPQSAYVRQRYNYLVFDPAVSLHFHIVQFDGSSVVVVDDDDPEEEDGGGAHHEQQHDDDGDDNEDDSFGTSVHVYSSETRRWRHIQIDWDRNESHWDDGHDLEGWRHQGLVPNKGSGCAILNGMLHFVISDRFGHIAAVDVQGATQRLIPLPSTNVWVSSSSGYVAQSQGRLHYINQDMFDARLFVWVLEDYDAGEWVLKHTVSFMDLFGKKSHARYKNDYNMVAMHP
ncbi:hypothetical protein U9M48_012168 [Paspalum notatum var. saurae]|uniref:F-box associated domain-containing protein n=1 Tax=Paspalum notatum var. saurae TaxID=547442 RepID=A0AAQ3WI30_PASNO